MSRRAELATALALDAAFGEPPLAVHPVVWMGRLADVLERRLPAPQAPGALAAGGAAWAVGVVAAATAGAAFHRAPWPVRSLVLWPLLAGRLLAEEVHAVEVALREQGVAAGRTQVARVVSRPAGDLEACEVRAAAVESLAENLSDSLVAPLWWWTVGGLPGAAAYRWVNTADARWGYRDSSWERRGKVAARADDLANLVPARLTALLLRGRLDRALRDEAARTPSPNAGWPMAAAALALDVRLAKAGAYTLHAAGRDPDATTIPAALRRAVLAAIAAGALTGWAAGRTPVGWAAGRCRGRGAS